MSSKASVRRDVVTHIHNNNGQHRGVISVAAVLSNEHDGYKFGNRLFRHNDNVSWAVLRDVANVRLSSGKFTGGTAILSLANVFMHNCRLFVNANTKSGTHVDAVKLVAQRDIGSKRFRDLVEGMSSQMTDTALHGTVANVPVNAGLYAGDYRHSFAIEAVGAFSPSPWAAFSYNQAETLFSAATEQNFKLAVNCYTCGAAIPHYALSRGEYTDDGNYVVECGSCGNKHKYSTGDTNVSFAKDYASKHFSNYFKHRFCDDLSRDLPVFAPFYMSYIATECVGDRDIVVHKFRKEATGDIFSIIAHGGSFVRQRKWHTFEPGEFVTCLYPDSPVKTRVDADSYKMVWNVLFDTHNVEDIAYMQKSWFDMQAVHLADTNTVLFPFELIAIATNSVRPLSLLWDCTNAEKKYNHKYSSYMLPCVPAKDTLTKTLYANGVTFDLGVGKILGV